MMVGEELLTLGKASINMIFMSARRRVTVKECRETDTVSEEVDPPIVLRAGW